MVVERFLKYVSFETTSDENNAGVKIPSSDLEFKLASYLGEELKSIGLDNVKVDEHAYVYGHLPASKGREGDPVLALIAHMDTSPSASGKDIKPRIIHYEGGDISLSDTVTIDLQTNSFLNNMKGLDLIVTDGTTLLGADDKAGIAEIVELVSILKNNPELSHPPISVCFTPDEEIGCGPDAIQMNELAADFGYTVDGGILGELEYENFNAADCKVLFHGINVHPGSAKDVMKSAILMAHDYISLMPKDEIPAKTSGYEGFYHINAISGDETEAMIHMIIRDHDMDKFETKKKTVQEIGEKVNKKWNMNCCEVIVKDSYYNMKEQVKPYIFLIDNAKLAMKNVGVTPIVSPIRGGTDGARLSFMGLPCPNLSTGGANYHSVRELIPVQSLEKMVDVLLELVKQPLKK